MNFKLLTKRFQGEVVGIEALEAAIAKTAAAITELDDRIASGDITNISKLSNEQADLKHRLTSYTQALEAAQRRQAVAAAELDTANRQKAKADATKRSKGYTKRLEVALAQIDNILAEFKDIQNEAVANMQANHKWGYELQYPDRNYHQINAFMGDKLREVRRHLGDFVKAVSHD